MLKTIVCALLSAILSVTAAVSVLGADDTAVEQAGVETRFWDDMEGWKVGKYANAKAIDPIYASAGSQVEIVENTIVPEMGKSFYVENTFFATQWDMTQPQAIKLYASTIAISFRMVLAEEESSCLMYAHVDTDDKEPAANNLEGTVLRATASEGILTGGAGYKLCDAEVGRPYDITILLYSNGGAPNVCRYDVYVDGEKRTPMPIMLMQGTGNTNPCFMMGLCFIKTEGKKLLLDDIEVKGGANSQTEELLRHTVTNLDPEQAASVETVKKRYNPDLSITCSFVDTGGRAEEQAILYLTQIGAFSQDSSGRFDPGRRITRAELAVCTARICGSPRAKYRNAFLDVNSSQWFANDLQGAFDRGLLAGMSDKGYFYPDSPADLADVLTAAMRVRESTGAIVQPADLSGYLDYKAIPTWAAESVAKAVAAGIITLTGDTIGCGRSVTRAEAAQLLFEAYKQI